MNLLHERIRLCGQHRAFAGAVVQSSEGKHRLRQRDEELVLFRVPLDEAGGGNQASAFLELATEHWAGGCCFRTCIGDVFLFYSRMFEAPFQYSGLMFGQNCQKPVFWEQRPTPAINRFVRVEFHVLGYVFVDCLESERKAH